MYSSFLCRDIIIIFVNIGNIIEYVVLDYQCTSTGFQELDQKRQSLTIFGYLLLNSELSSSKCRLGCPLPICPGDMSSDFRQAFSVIKGGWV